MINDLKEFEKMLKICRRQSVSEISLEGITLKFWDKPEVSQSTDSSDQLQTDEPTPEQLTFYAV